MYMNKLETNNVIIYYITFKCTKKVPTLYYNNNYAYKVMNKFKKIVTHSIFKYFNNTS